MSPNKPFSTPGAMTRVSGFLSIALLAGCASVPTANPRDPLEPLNRGVYQLNDGVDKMVIKPFSIFYTTVTPPFLQKGVHNFFDNLGDAWSAINSALQLRGQDTVNSLSRFVINSTFGLGGLFDVATTHAKIPQKRQDFGLTLGRWGIDSGPYLVLPLLGPSTLRDGVALPVDMKASIVGAVQPVDSRNGLLAMNVISKRADFLEVEKVFMQAALDPYVMMRDAYLQNRDTRVQELRGLPAAPDNKSASNDGYVPPADDGYAPPEDQVGMAPSPAPAPAVSATASSSAAPTSAASAPVPQPDAQQAVPEHSGQTPYYTPTLPQWLNRLGPGWGGNLWRK